MPAITADTLTLPRVGAPGPADTERPVRSITTGPRGYEGEGFPVVRAFAGVTCHRHVPTAPRRQPAATLSAATAPWAEPWARPVQAACLPAPAQVFCQNAANPHAKRQIQGVLRVARQCPNNQHSRQSWPPHWRDTGQRADLVGRFAYATAPSTKKAGCTQATIRRPRPAL